MSEFKASEDVWVVERDPETDERYGKSCYVCLAQVNDYVICSAQPYGIYDFNEMLEYLSDETLENDGETLFVFPVSECYHTREDADNA